MVATRISWSIEFSISRRAGVIPRPKSTIVYSYCMRQKRAIGGSLREIGMAEAGSGGAGITSTPQGDVPTSVFHIFRSSRCRF